MQERDTEGFVVAGVSERVRNDDPAAIGALWGRFQSDDLRAQLGDAASREVYCVYHDYEGRFSDPYRMTIGYRMPADVQVPSDVHRAEIPAQQLVSFHTEGPQPQTLVEQWQAIWADDLKRAYQADYDVYDPEMPERVTVNVGVINR